MSPSSDAESGNTECPDAKGIKTPMRRDISACDEILNALMQKGLRQGDANNQQSSREILNALMQKGLRRPDISALQSELGNTECPDAKGIKTLSQKRRDRGIREILNALMQKGLRPQIASFRDAVAKY